MRFEAETTLFIHVIRLTLTLLTIGFLITTFEDVGKIEVSKIVDNVENMLIDNDSLQETDDNEGDKVNHNPYDFDR